jgi:hypothetical protein
MTDIEFYTEYMIWGDYVAMNAIEKITEEEYRRSFGEMAGSIASKAEFFFETELNWYLHPFGDIQLDMIDKHHDSALEQDTAELGD